MFQDLLLSYWWILTLLLILIVVITRNVIKTLVGLVILIALLFVFDFLFVSPAAEKTNACINALGLESAESAANFMNYSAGEERRNYVCTSGEESLDKFFGCMDTVKKENEMSFNLFATISGYGKNISDTVDLHNENCTENQVEKPAYIN